LNEYGAGAPLPSPAQQAVNLIRSIGDHRSATGLDYSITAGTVATMGALNEASACRICNELIERNLIIDRGMVNKARGRRGTISIRALDLSLDGWEKYEAARRGM